jgi:hypothetical protein
LDLPLFIDGQNYGMRRRVKRPAMSRTFAAKGGSFESLNVRMRCGWSPCERQTRWTSDRLTPVTFAIARPVQGGVFARRFGERQSHDPLGHLRTQGALAVQRGRSIELRPSEMCLTSLDHIGESRLSEGGRYTALRMPRRDLMAMSKNIEDKIAKPLQG